MKKILIPVKASEELPEQSGVYIADNNTLVSWDGSKWFVTWIEEGEEEPITHEIDDVLIWYKEVSEEEYLISKLIQNQKS